MNLRRKTKLRQQINNKIRNSQARASNGAGSVLAALEYLEPGLTVTHYLI